MDSLRTRKILKSVSKVSILNLFVRDEGVIWENAVHLVFVFVFQLLLHEFLEVLDAVHFSFFLQEKVIMVKLLIHLLEVLFELIGLLGHLLHRSELSPPEEPFFVTKLTQKYFLVNLLRFLCFLRIFFSFFGLEKVSPSLLTWPVGSKLHKVYFGC
jgi:hypothetical protein